MDQAAILAQVNETFRAVFDDPALTVATTTTAKDVPGWDSITHITLVIELEMRFGVKFAMAEIERLRNVGELVALLEAKLPR